MAWLPPAEDSESKYGKNNQTIQSISIFENLARDRRYRRADDRAGADQGSAGNISVFVRAVEGVDEHFWDHGVIDLPVACPALQGGWMIVTGTGRRIRDLSGTGIGPDHPRNIGRRAPGHRVRRLGRQTDQRIEFAPGYSRRPGGSAQFELQRHRPRPARAF